MQKMKDPICFSRPEPSVYLETFFVRALCPGLNGLELDINTEGFEFAFRQRQREESRTAIKIEGSNRCRSGRGDYVANQARRNLGVNLEEEVRSENVPNSLHIFGDRW